MKNFGSHTLENIQKDWATLPRFLNDTGNAAQRKRVLTLLDKFRELARATSTTELVAEINVMLGKYRMTLAEQVSMIPGLLISPQPTRQEPTETHAVSMIVSMAEAGMLDRVKKCGWCSQWFVASRADRIFCSEPCKRKHQSSSPEYKRERAEYMRRRYQLLKDRKEQAQ